MSGAPKAAIYCRLSEEDRDKPQNSESESIQNQKSMLLHYAMEQGWEVYQIYSDDDYRGSDRQRPAFHQLLTDAEQRRFDIVLCKSQSRFTRELELVETYLHGFFPLWNIRFVGLVDHADTENKGNKKARQINGLVNEWYLEDLSESIKSVLADKQHKGQHIGSFALYGYQKDPDCKGHLLVDEEAAAVVREIFALFSKGYGKTAIARLLNERGVPTPSEYKRQKGLHDCSARSVNSTLWKYYTVAHMLTNEMYLGNMVQGKYGTVSYKIQKNRPKPREQWIRVEGTHEPIVDRSLWERVQERLAQRAKPFSSGKVGLLAQKVRCQFCGYTLRSHVLRDGRRYLRCPTRMISGAACPGGFISVERLEQTVLEEWNRLVGQYWDPKWMTHLKNLPSAQEEDGRLEKEWTRCRAQKKEYEAALQQAYLDKIRGTISEGEYRIFSQGFAEKQEALERQIGWLAKKREEGQRKEKERAEGVEAPWNLDRLDREAVDQMVEWITVGRRDPKTGELPVEIHWNF